MERRKAVRLGLEITAKVAAVAWFGYFLWTAGNEAWALLQPVLAGTAGIALVQRLAARTANALFLLLVVGAYLFRSAARRKAPGLLPRVATVAGMLFPIVMWISPVAVAKVPALGVVVEDPAARGVLLAVGTGLFAAGQAACVLVMLWLGRSFSLMAEARRLVTSGPYAVVRHPLYVCEAIAALGLVLTYDTVIAWILLATHLPIQFLRARYEERVLAAEFAEYAAYRERTAMLFPGIH
jgi:protein-S-isoprenylcysteine O-methyltransferase Ste14